GASWRRRSRWPVWVGGWGRVEVRLGSRGRRRGEWTGSGLGAWRISVGGGRGEYGRRRAVASSHRPFAPAALRMTCSLAFVSPHPLSPSPRCGEGELGTALSSPLSAYAER